MNDVINGCSAETTMRFLAFMLVTVVTWGWLQSAEASLVTARYDVSSTPVVNASLRDGTPAPHGLWAPRYHYRRNRPAYYFDIQDGTEFTEYADGTATLIGSAINPFGTVATIDLSFSGFMDALPDPSVYKAEGGGSYNAATQDFYSGISGDISFAYGSRSLGTMTLTKFVGDHVLQIGDGANAKNLDFGASGWVLGEWTAGYRAGRRMAGHWDLNLNLERQEIQPNPEPATIVVWSMLALVGLAAYRRKKLVA